MKIISNILLLVFTVAFFSACAQPKNKVQSNNGIVKTEFFLQERMPGTIAVDENGNPMSQGPFLDYKAVVETGAGKQPTFKRVWINGKSYSVSVSEVTTPYRVGVSKESEQPAIVNVSKGNKLWELSMQEDESSKTSRKGNSSGIVLEGSYNGKAFSLPVNVPVKKLASPLYM